MTGQSVETTEPFNLTIARINAGLSIRGLARKLNTHEQTIRRLEQGLPARPESAKPIADFFGVKVTDLLGVEPVTTESSTEAAA